MVTLAMWTATQCRQFRDNTTETIKTEGDTYCRSRWTSLSNSTSSYIRQSERKYVLGMNVFDERGGGSMVERGEHLKLVREVPKCVYSKLREPAMTTLTVFHSQLIHTDTLIEHWLYYHWDYTERKVRGRDGWSSSLNWTSSANEADQLTMLESVEVEVTHAGKQTVERGHTVDGCFRSYEGREGYQLAIFLLCVHSMDLKREVAALQGWTTSQFSFSQIRWRLAWSHMKLPCLLHLRWRHKLLWGKITLPYLEVGKHEGFNPESKRTLILKAARFLGTVFTMCVFIIPSCAWECLRHIFRRRGY